MTALLAVAGLVVVAALLFVKNDGEAEPPIARMLRRLRRARDETAVRLRDAGTSRDAREIDALAQLRLIAPADYVRGHQDVRRHRRLILLVITLIGVLIAGIAYYADEQERRREASRYELRQLSPGMTIMIDRRTGATWRVLPSGAKIPMSPGNEKPQP